MALQKLKLRQSTHFESSSSSMRIVFERRFDDVDTFVVRALDEPATFELVANDGDLRITRGEAYRCQGEQEKLRCPRRPHGRFRSSLRACAIAVNPNGKRSGVPAGSSLSNPGT